VIIEAKVLSFLRRYIPNSNKRLDKDRWEIPKGSTVARALECLCIPEDQDIIFLVNGCSADVDRVLTEGDVLTVFPPISGG
jgi:sulfur carrier protein ThiS